MSFAATWKDLEIIILSDVSQTKTYDIPCMWMLKKGTKELIYRMEIESQI